ncbi:MAG: hypothetical protein WDN28_27365 [Chthoniobacter sp.]
MSLSDPALRIVLYEGTAPSRSMAPRATPPSARFWKKATPSRAVPPIAPLRPPTARRSSSLAASMAGRPKPPRVTSPFAFKTSARSPPPARRRRGNRAKRNHTARHGAWKPWFPVIDYDRCTNCMQCLSFCLFGVYGVDGDKHIQVQNNDHCKTNCPACSRVCPEAAIMFPKYKAGPINGDVVSDSDLAKRR